MLASLASAVAVMLGAFGAHALRARLGPELVAVYQTGVLYHFIHALALAIVALALEAGMVGRLATLAGIAFLIGIVVFSGSLYTLALTGQRAWGAVTPLGGLAFIAGWILLAASTLGSRA